MKVDSRKDEGEEIGYGAKTSLANETRDEARNENVGSSSADDERLRGISISQTKIAFGLDRYLYFFYVMVFIFFHGPIVMNFGYFEKTFVLHGAFSSYCSGPQIPGVACDAQATKIADLGTIGTSVMFCGAGLAGFLADKFGPKVPGMLGPFLMALSFMLLAFASEHRQGLYTAWAIVCGLAIETCFFSILSTANLFEKSGTAVAILGTIRSLSMFYSEAFEKMATPSFGIKNASLVFMAVALFFMIANTFLLPMRPFLDMEKEKANALLEIKSNEYNVNTGANISEQEHAENLKAYKVRDGTQYSTMDNLKLLFNETKSVYLICWFIAFALVYARGTFYPVQVSRMHPEVASLFGRLAPFSFVLCPVFGYVADRFGGLLVILILNVVGTIVVGLGFTKNSAAQYIGVVLTCFITLSFLASQCYVLIHEQYAEKVRGKICGLALLIAGLFALTNMEIQKYANNNEPDGRKKMLGVYLGYSAIAFICMGAMYLLRGMKPSLEKRLNKQRSKLAQV